MKNKKYKVIFFTAIAIFLIAVTLLLLYLFPTLFKEEKVVKQPEPVVQQNEEVLPENPKNFDALQKKNPNIYAWITVPGTKVDYPVLQSSKLQPENFYINHDLKDRYLFAGSIYSQKYNSKDFTDPNTILYGHNMRDDSMFGSLHEFRKKKFFNKYRYIYIYTRGHVLTYKIYAAYRYDNRHILNSFDFSDPQVVTDYFNMTLNPKTTMKNIDSTTTLTNEDRIITLSTCITNDNYRYLVQGVLIDDKRTQ